MKKNGGDGLALQAVQKANAPSPGRACVLESRTSGNRQTLRCRLGRHDREMLGEPTAIRGSVLLTRNGIERRVACDDRLDDGCIRGAT